MRRFLYLSLMAVSFLICEKISASEESYTFGQSPSFIGSRTGSIYTFMIPYPHRRDLSPLTNWFKDPQNPLVCTLSNRASSWKLEQRAQSATENIGRWTLETTPQDRDSQQLKISFWDEDEEDGLAHFFIDGAILECKALSKSVGNDRYQIEYEYGVKLGYSPSTNTATINWFWQKD